MLRGIQKASAVPWTRRAISRQAVVPVLERVFGTKVTKELFPEVCSTDFLKFSFAGKGYGV